MAQLDSNKTTVSVKTLHGRCNNRSSDMHDAAISFHGIAGIRTLMMPLLCNVYGVYDRVFSNVFVSDLAWGVSSSFYKLIFR